MAKGAYYAGMATAPQVKPADFLTPLTNMFERLTQQSINKRKQQQATEKENAKFSLSQQGRLEDVVNSTSFKGFGIDQLDMASKSYTGYVDENFKKANADFNAGLISKSQLSSITANLMNSSRSVQNLGNSINGFMQTNSKLEMEGKDSHYNDLVMSFIGDLGNNVRFDTNSSGGISLITVGEDGVEKKLPANQIKNFLQPRAATDINGVLEDIVSTSKPNEYRDKNNIYYRYLDNGQLTQPQSNQLTKRLLNLSPEEIYDASVRAGIVGDDEGQLNVLTDFANEGEITEANLDTMRQRLGIYAAESLTEKYESLSKNVAIPATKKGAPKINSVYDENTGMYSFLKGTQTSVVIRQPFTGRDVDNGKPYGDTKKVQTGSYVSDVKMTPSGLEVWGVNYIDTETNLPLSNDTLDFSKIGLLSSQELKNKRIKREAFHKILDPDKSNTIAISQLQRVFGFDIDEYNNQLEVIDEEDKPELETGWADPKE
jgi:hypothetical protein|tara:strand:+ start:52 stop:1512 length:1461 start_codon:yes stop_codon:yes gene_type:complete